MKVAKLSVDPKKVIGTINPEVFGSFVEHLGRSVYDGLYEPSHSQADKQGFRLDVLKAIRDLGVSIIRYPGGNFVSQYQWKNAIGPKEKRPANLNLAWHEIEPNLVGVDEMVPAMKAIGSDVMMAFNLGTGSVQDAADLVEYCNLKTETQYAKMRRENGHPDPYGITYWCLGNEMDGSWQICHMNAEDYAKKALATAEVVKLVDPEAKLVLAGSNSPYSPTFPAWDKTVLHVAFEKVDYLALHGYFTYPDLKEKNVPEFLGVAKDFENYIQTSEKLIEEERTARKSEKRIYLSIDEWNIWHSGFCSEASGQKEWTYANHLLEQSYDYADMLAFSSLLLTILNHVDSVKIACLAQLVNVIAPISTQHDGGLFLQTIYHPFAILANSVKGYDSLAVSGDVPTYRTKRFGEVKALYQNVAYSKEEGEYVVSLLNVGQEEIDLEIALPVRGDLLKEFAFEDIGVHEKNTFEEPEKVHPKEFSEPASYEGEIHKRLKPLSFYVLYIKERSEKI